MSTTEIHTTFTTIHNTKGLPCDAELLRRQIGRTTLAACGASQFVDLGDGLKFKVGGRRNTWLVIKLNGRDLFDVALGRMTKTFDFVTIDTDTDLFADDLADAITRMVER